jgi:hypothetical protein
LNDVMWIDNQEDFNQNRQTFSRYKYAMEQIKEVQNGKLRFFRLPKFQHSTFVSMPSDLVTIQNMGRILDNSRAAYHPLTIFNTSTLQLFEYYEKLQKFEKIEIKDETNLVAKMP